MIGKFKSWFRRGGASDEEIQIHLDLLKERYIRQGMDEEQAFYAARRQFGGTTKLKQELHESSRFWHLEALLLDVRYAFRSLRKAPAFTLAAVGALVIGIGANTAIFSVVDKVLLKPLTYPEPSRIVLFFVRTPQGPSYGASAAKFNIWRRQTGIFQNVAAYEYRGSNLNVTGGSFPEQIHSIRVSADYFHLLGAPIIQGRPFTMQEDQPSAGHVVVLSYGFWQRRFGGDDHVVGRTISLGGAPYNIVGVIGPSFKTELDSVPDIFLPFQIDAASTDHAQYFNVVGRLRPGMEVAAAKAQLQLAANEFHRRFPNIMGAKDGFDIELFQDAIVAEARRSLLMLSGAVIFVLLISCANVANLLFARATGRKQEMAVRTAVGAGRGRIIRQLLTESMVLSLVGGLLGLVAGWFGVKALVAINPGDIPRLGEHGSAIVMDGRLLLFTLLLSVATGVLFGLIPALDVSRADIGIALKESGGRSGRSHRQTRTRSLLIASETALAVILLIGAGLLIRSFLSLRTMDRGVDTRSVLTLRMSLAGSRFTKSSEVAELVRQATRRLQDLPGIAQACASYNLPLEGLFGIPFNIVGRNSTVGQYDGRGWLTVSPGYFEIFKIPLLRGRVFTERDDLHAQPIAIINQAMARRYWPGGNPIGQRVMLGKGYGPEFEEPAREIVGVVGDVLNLAAYGSKAPEPAVYVPVAQVTDGITTLMMQASSLAWIVRTRGESQSLRPAIENALRQATGGLVVARVRSMDDVAIQYTAGASFQTTLLSIFGGAALLLAANGLYGLMAYSLQQRTHEIGIRLALGAELSRVRNMLVFQGMRWALLGTALGIGAALGLSRLLASSLFGVSAWDPLTFFAVPAFLIAILLVAVWIPSRSATRVDPVVALRHE